MHSGAGGVGHVAIQLAVARGARVYATGTGAAMDVIRLAGATVPGDTSGDKQHGHLLLGQLLSDGLDAADRGGCRGSFCNPRHGPGSQGANQAAAGRV